MSIVQNIIRRYRIKKAFEMGSEPPKPKGKKKDDEVVQKYYKALKGTERRRFFNDVFKVAQKSEHANHLKNIEQFQKYEIWDVGLGRYQNVVFFALFHETPQGLRIHHIGHDGSAEARSFLQDFVSKRLKEPGIYGEIPASMIYLVDKLQLPVVDPSQAAYLRGKKTHSWSEDENRYNRWSRRKQKWMSKIMVGTPLPTLGKDRGENVD